MPPRGVRTRRVRAVVADDEDLAEVREREARRDGVVHLDEHPFEALVEVDAVLGGVEDTPLVSTLPVASSSITVFGGMRPPVPITVGAGSGLPVRENGDDRAA